MIRIPDSPYAMPIDPAAEPDLYGLLAAAVTVGAHVQHTLDPSHVLKTYIVKRTPDAERKEQHIDDSNEPSLADWLAGQRDIVREWFGFEPQVRRAGYLQVNFTDEIAAAMKAIGVEVRAWEDYIVPVAFDDLNQDQCSSATQFP
jgi:hypothetical protein